MQCKAADIEMQWNNKFNNEHSSSWKHTFNFSDNSPPTQPSDKQDPQEEE